MLDIKVDPPVMETGETPATVESSHVVADDWSANWNGSVAIKITALVVWMVIGYSFVIALILLNKTTAEFEDKMDYQAEYTAYELVAYNYHLDIISNLDEIKEILLNHGFLAARISINDKDIWIGEPLSRKRIKELPYITQPLLMPSSGFPDVTLDLFHLPHKQLAQGEKIKILVIIVLSILGFGFMHVYITSRVLKRPFEAMEEASQGVINGDLSIRMDTRRQDEFGNLANFFNSMLERVQQDKNEIDEINSNLEDIVNDRTKELKQTNSELKGTLEHLQEIQNQLVESEHKADAANEAKSLFLANMSHEIRTPMNAILGYTQILQGDNTLTTDQHESIEAISSSSNHLLSLINNILDISKIEAGKMELNIVDFDLNQLFLDISSMFSQRCEKKRLSWNMRTDIETNSLMIQGDENKLRQVLINLLSNAIKFTESGDITLSMKELKQNGFFFEVTDTGPGISNQGQKTIFETFKQDEQGLIKGGTGLGLAISKKHIKLMGGNLEVESTLKKGTRFYFTIPMDTAVASSPEIITQQPTMHLAKGEHIKALIVDDIAENCMVLSKMLGLMGIETEQAKDGESSIIIAKEFKPDIIFMDYKMPGINGIEAIDHIRQVLGNSFKSVIVTAHAFDQDTQRFRVENLDDVIAKPFTFNAIYSCLANHLNVQFDTEEMGLPDKNQAANVLGNITTSGIPQDLTLKLKEAVKFGVITDIEDIASQIGQTDKVYQPFAQLLKQFINKFDMPAIRKLVGKL